jgi:hypothetical protein
MKIIKLLPVICFICVGLGSAYAKVKRVDYVYVNVCPGYTKIIVVYNPAKCINPDIKPCCYIVHVDLGPSASEAQLIAAGGVPCAAKKCYVP